jgi:Rieske Fe-S protein
MDRKEFIKTCGFACLTAAPLSLFIQSCAGSKMITAQITGENIVFPLTDFEVMKKKVKTFRNFIIIQNELLKYPIYVYRFSEQDYVALYMQCTHQGAELTAYGDKMVCSAHGSEFDNRGKATSAPAEKPLRSFPVSIENQNLIISLKAS